MHRLRELTLAVSIVAMVGALAPATAAWAEAAPSPRLGIQLLDAPVNAKNDPRAHVYIVDQLSTSSTITRHVRVTNYTQHQVAVAIYAAAASIGGGEFRFAPARTANELTSWTSVTPSSATLQAQGSVEVTVRIAVPDHTTTGERYAVIWAEQSSQAVAGSAQEINRVGVRVYLDIAGNVQPSDFAITAITAARDSTGRPTVSAQVRDTGLRAVDVAGTIALSEGPGGLQTGPVNTNPTLTLAPQQTGSVSASFDRRLQAGPWLVTVNLSSGTIRHQATATVTFPAAAHAPVTVPVHRAEHSLLWLWWLLGALAMLVGFILWLVWRRRKRKRPTDPPPPSRPVPSRAPARSTPPVARRPLPPRDLEKPRPAADRIR